MEAKEHMAAGGLVPDAVMVGLIGGELKDSIDADRGWLLDGFPRTKTQAQALQDLYKVTSLD